MDAVASTFAVVSLSIQLVESIKKLNDFWSSIKEAPANVHAILNDLSLLSSILSDIATETQEVGSADTTLEKVLCSCELSVQELYIILSNLQLGFDSKKRSIRQWTAVKSILKSDKIETFQAVLERLKSSLMLARQNHIR